MPPQENIRVLVVTEDPAEAERRRRILARHGYAVDEVASGNVALQTYVDSDFMLLDLDLPDVDGVEVCRSIRAVSSLPIITFCASNNEADRIVALQAGSDDCVAIGCGEREVLARIEAVLCRSHSGSGGPASSKTTMGPLQLDHQSYQARLNGELLALTSTEFRLLQVLVAQPSQVLTRKTLVEAVWNAGWVNAGRTVDTHVKNIRAKLGREWIVTVRGVGYRLGAGV